MRLSDSVGTFIGIVWRSLRLTRRSTATAAPRIVAGIRLKTIRSILLTLDADHRQNDHARRFGIGVDIFAATRAHVVGKSDDLAHCKFPHSAVCLPEATGAALSAIKGLARLTVCYDQDLDSTKVKWSKVSTLSG